MAGMLSNMDQGMVELVLATAVSDLLDGRRSQLGTVNHLQHFIRSVDLRDEEEVRRFLARVDARARKL